MVPSREGGLRSAASGVLGMLLHGVRLVLLLGAAAAAAGTVWALARAKRCGDTLQARR